MKKKTKKPLFNHEKNLGKTFDLVFGIDEVGRGAFAGPLIACAVSFNNQYSWFSDVNDSKLLTPKKRERISKLILKNSLCFIETIDVEVINEFGVGEANKIAFENLVNRIRDEYKNRKIHFLIDGRKKNINYEHIEYVVKGDQKHISIAAASIVAKVFRDSLMKEYSKVYREYKFSKNKGYGTKFHRESLKKLGLSKIHRTSFKLSKFLSL